MSKPDAKPHRRLSLTLPTLPYPTTEETEPQPSDEAAIDASLGQQNSALESPLEVTSVRVMAYLTPGEAELLDDLWIALRRGNARASKSDILRAALTLAGNQKEELASVIANQQVSTLIRQRGRKATGK
jgi:hypothetical protein